MPRTANGTGAAKNKSQSVDVQEQENNMQAEIETLKKQLEMMQAMIANQANVLQGQAQVQAEDYEVKDIEVISLTNARLILSTNGKGDGRKYQFTQQFESIIIPEDDLREIVHAMPQTVSNGYCFINDPMFVKKNRLSGSYRNILDKTGMVNVLTLSPKDFVAKYNSVPKAQQSIIESMVVDTLLNGGTVDANILMELKNHTGMDYFTIEPIESAQK